MSLEPFWAYYGGKWRAAPRYPFPEYDTIIEPFAGAAGYSLRYPDRKVILLDKDEIICGIWKYLIEVSPQEILSLPDVGNDQSVDDLPGLPPEARWIIGFWLNKGAAAPCKRPSVWMKSGVHPESQWGPEVRRRIANQVGKIRHWTITRGTYADAPDIEATWFIDPPYQLAGKHYRQSAKGIDFKHLGDWCRNRQGQVMVCENEGADWLPFERFGEIKANPGARGGKMSAEVLWMNKPLGIIGLFGS